LYTKVNQEGKILIVCLYVDDLIFIGDILVNEFNIAMKTEFEMNNLGMMKYFIGIEINQSEDSICICQTKYEKDILKRFRMVNCKPTVTPIATGTKLSNNDEGSFVDPNLYKKLGGSLMDLTTTRPDIMFAVSLLSRFMKTLKSTH